jgi:hypothetical protein
MYKESKIHELNRILPSIVILSLSSLLLILFSLGIEDMSHPGNWHQVLAQEKASQQPAPAATNNLLTYQNSAYKYKIQYPSSWLVVYSNTTRGLVIFGSSHTGSDLRLRLLYSPSGSLDIYTVTHILSLRANGISPSIPNSTSLANLTAKQISFHFPSGDRVMQKFAINNKTVYLFTFEANPEVYSKDLPIANKIINSLQIFR